MRFLWLHLGVSLKNLGFFDLNTNSGWENKVKPIVFGEVRSLEVLIQLHYLHPKAGTDLTDRAY